MMKFFYFTTLLMIAVLGLLDLPSGNINADLLSPTPITAISIKTKLQPDQGVNDKQSDGRLIGEVPWSGETHPFSALTQPTFNATADAIVMQGYSAQNFGSTSDMWAGYDDYLEPDGQIVRSLVKFDITSLPSSRIINTATLRVYLVSYYDYPATSRTITSNRVTADWSENSVTWNNQPSMGEAYGSKSIVSGAGGWYEFDVTNLVSGWYNGIYANYGIMLRGPEVSGLDCSWRSFSTREGLYAPQLLIGYTEPVSTSTSTPTSTLIPASDKLIYLPLLSKNGTSSGNPTYTPTLIVASTNTPTPTNTPTSTSTPITAVVPKDGSWTGTNPTIISFPVSGGGTQISSLTVTTGMCGGGGVTMNFWWSISIANGAFSANNGGNVITGTFTSSNTAQGTYDVACGYPSTSRKTGTWNASTP